MQNDVVIVGAGGHAKVVIDVFKQSDQFEPVVCLDAHIKVGTMVEGIPVAGDDSVLASLRRDGVGFAFVAVGENSLRQRLIQYVQQLGFRIPNAISPYAYIAPSATLGSGIVVMPGAIVGPQSTLGNGTIVNTKASVDHDCVVETCAHIAPGVTLAGGVCVEPLTLIGAGATVIPQVRVGRCTIVGAGAVVVSDLPSFVVAHGVPARIQRRLDRKSAA